MSLEKEVIEGIKLAMKAKDKNRLETLRSIKSALLNAKTAEGATGDFTKEQEVKLLQKLQKQRKDALAIYEDQKREDLAKEEKEQLAVIESFLPAPLSDEALTNHLKKIIEREGVTSIKDMGKVMKIASKELNGQADGKTISTKVKFLLR
jgi:uncharacterized protein YqeY